MVPDKMSVVEVYLLYSHIFSQQDTPDAFKFTPIDEAADDEIIGSPSSPGHGSLVNEDGNVSMPANSPATGVVQHDVVGSPLSPGSARDSLANNDVDLSTPANSASTGVVGDVAGARSSPGCGLLADEDSDIPKPSTGAVGDASSVSDTNDGSSDAIVKESGTKSTKKRPSKGNEIPDGVPAKKQRKSK